MSEDTVAAVVTTSSITTMCSQSFRGAPPMIPNAPIRFACLLFLPQFVVWCDEFLLRRR